MIAKRKVSKRKYGDKIGLSKIIAIKGNIYRSRDEERKAFEQPTAMRLVF